MIYIIMCGGTYPRWRIPKQMAKVNGEVLVDRTIRLLRENGITNIAISSNNPAFEKYGVPVLRHNNDWLARNYNDYDGYWVNAFYPVNGPVCYLFGDVYYSPEAIRTIVEYETDDIMFFGSKPPFHPDYIKNNVEPFAFKVQNVQHLFEACDLVKELDAQGKFSRKPLAWELWFVICGADVEQETDCGNIKDERARNYVVINDYTCDLDYPRDAKRLTKVVAK